MHRLMLKDEEVMQFDLEEFWIEVKRPELLPFALRDCVKTTNAEMGVKQVLQQFEILKDWLASRVLSLSRSNAKVILNVAALPQSLKTSERLKICLACKGLTMSDSYWLKEDNEDFRSNDLRKHRLCEVSYQIAILGKHVSATRKELRPDLSATGMFPKFWKRTGFLVELWKTDRTDGFVNTEAELQVSEILDSSNVSHVKYRREKIDEKVFAVSSCIADDKFSMVNASEVRDWCNHCEKDFLSWVLEKFGEAFKKMCLVDYVIANTDRHFDNWGFMMDNETGALVSMIPLFDHNQSLIADEIGTEIEELIYEPTGLTFKETVEMYRGVNLVITGVLPQKVEERFRKCTDR